MHKVGVTYDPSARVHRVRWGVEPIEGEAFWMVQPVSLAVVMNGHRIHSQMSAGLRGVSLMTPWEGLKGQAGRGWSC